VNAENSNLDGKSSILSRNGMPLEKSHLSVAGLSEEKFGIFECYRICNSKKSLHCNGKVICQ